jgi:glucose 1-dehydrogenase
LGADGAEHGADYQGKTLAWQPTRQVAVGVDIAGVEGTAMTAQSRPLLGGQRALVTGASSGIGAAVAKALAAAGAAVAINHSSRQSTAAAEAVAAGIAETGGKAIVVRADVSREDEVEGMFARVLEAFGRLDILVANSGIQRDAGIGDMTLAQWQEVLDVNLTGQFLCARAALRCFAQQGIEPALSRAAGKIICMSSVHQRIPWAGHLNYAAAKGGVHLLMETLAQEVASQRVRVNALAPGAIRTGINRPAWETPEALERLLKLIPYGRIGEPEDVAKAAVWLASDESDYVTGATLFVDGGMSLYPEFRDGG